MAYTKKEIIDAIAENTDLPASTVETVLNDFVDMVVETMQADDEISYPNLGKFFSKVRAARQGRNPHTGESMEIPAKRQPKFTPAASMKKAVAGS